MGRRANTPASQQSGLPFEQPVGEDQDYLSKQLLTYIGNKRILLDPIRAAVETVCKEQGKSQLRIFDAFSGSGVVTRLFKRFASELVVNDIEAYSRVVNQCYLANRSVFPYAEVHSAIERLNKIVINDVADQEGFIRRLYSPRDEENITVDDRVFYTRENARRLDAYRNLIAAEPPELFPYLMGPLLSEASVHANTAGVFKGFYKDRATGIGQFGGSGSDALLRIKGKIHLYMPVLSNYECDYEIFQSDTNELVKKVGDFDLVYLDPPYNQHPYGSNYFMLNLLVDYQEPHEISKVSGIPTDWKRSPWYVRSKSLPNFQQLVRDVDARFILISFNDEGFIPIGAMRRVLDNVGTVQEFQIKYNTFRGSRNLGNRTAHVTEHLFLVDKLRR